MARLSKKETINLTHEDIVNEIINDFKSRQQERKKFEANWQLNINFFLI